MLITPTPAFGQEYPAGFPYDSFAANAKIATWLAAYDRMAWVSSDSLLALPDSLRAGVGSEWFCVQEGEHWRAVYGRLDSITGTYHSVAEYLKAGSLVRRAHDRLNPAEAEGYARALKLTAVALSSRVGERAPAHNSYIRRSRDGRYEVWYLPAWQTNGVLVLGTQYFYVTDASARAIVDSQIPPARLTGIRPSRERDVVIESHDREVPSVGELFVLLAYGWAFRKLYIETRRFRTTFMREGPGVWLHAIRE